MDHKQVPQKLYHGLTIDQFLDHWKAGEVRGLSRFHLNPTEANGTYLSDSFDYILEHRHGLEIVGEGDVLADWGDLFGKLGLKGYGLIREQHYKTRTIIELSGVPEPKRLVPHFLPHQFFYGGNIPCSYIEKVHVDQLRPEVKEEDMMRLLRSSVPEEIIRIYDRFSIDKPRKHIF